MGAPRLEEQESQNPRSRVAPPHCPQEGKGAATLSADQPSICTVGSTCGHGSGGRRGSQQSGGGSCVGDRVGRGVRLSFKNRLPSLHALYLASSKNVPAPPAPSEGTDVGEKADYCKGRRLWPELGVSVTQFGAILSLVGAELFPPPTLLPRKQPDFETPSSRLGWAVRAPGTAHRSGHKEPTGTPLPLSHSSVRRAAPFPSTQPLLKPQGLDQGAPLLTANHAHAQWRWPSACGWCPPVWPPCNPGRSSESHLATPSPGSFLLYHSTR